MAMMTMKIEFNEEQHIYTVDGRIVPSVTEIIKFLNIDTFATANTVLKQIAADKGTRVHESTVIFDYEAWEFEYDSDIIGYIKAYSRFVRDYGIKSYIQTEHIISNGEYAGTLDRLAIIDGKKTVIDLKTGTTSNPRAFAAQLYGYAKILVDIGNGSLNDYAGMIVKLKKDGTYSAIQYDLNRGKTFFNACFNLWKMIQEDKTNGRTSNRG